MTTARPAPIFILDISRLLSRAGQAVPTGIDRVEFAYAEYLLHHHPQDSYFTALAFTGWMGALPRKMVKDFVSALASGWNLGDQKSITRAARTARLLKAWLLLARPLPRFERPVVYLLLSHHHLMKTETIRRFLKRNQARFVPMVHDLIPMEYPEYARPREPGRHRARMKTVVALADAVIVPTKAVGTSLHPLFLAAKRGDVPICPIPHGVHEQVLTRLAHIPAQKAGQTPYFVYLSTIEPRKNHLLLLHLWRDMVEKRGKANTPRLILVGKRGWENENILDLLERCSALQDVVTEKNTLSDTQIAALLKGSNGLLFSSFSEGYGLPLAEAISLSVPSICADIPVLREVGGDIPCYIDPLDTPGWEKAIDDFAQHGPLWQEQISKLKDWSPLPWSRSVAQALTYCVTSTAIPDAATPNTKTH